MSKVGLLVIFMNVFLSCKSMDTKVDSRYARAKGIESTQGGSQFDVIVGDGRIAGSLGAGRQPLLTQANRLQESAAVRDGIRRLLQFGIYQRARVMGASGAVKGADDIRESFGGDLNLTDLEGRDAYFPRQLNTTNEEGVSHTDWNDIEGWRLQRDWILSVMNNDVLNPGASSLHNREQFIFDQVKNTFGFGETTLYFQENYCSNLSKLSLSSRRRHFCGATQEQWENPASQVVWARNGSGIVNETRNVYAVRYNALNYSVFDINESGFNEVFDKDDLSFEFLSPALLSSSAFKIRDEFNRFFRRNGPLVSGYEEGLEDTYIERFRTHRDSHELRNIFILCNHGKSQLDAQSVNECVDEYRDKFSTNLTVKIAPFLRDFYVDYVKNYQTLEHLKNPIFTSNDEVNQMWGGSLLTWADASPKVFGYFQLNIIPKPCLDQSSDYTTNWVAVNAENSPWQEGWACLGKRRLTSASGTPVYENNLDYFRENGNFVLRIKLTGIEYRNLLHQDRANGTFFNNFRFNLNDQIGVLLFPIEQTPFVDIDLADILSGTSTSPSIKMVNEIAQAFPLFIKDDPSKPKTNSLNNRDR